METPKKGETVNDLVLNLHVENEKLKRLYNRVGTNADNADLQKEVDEERAKINKEITKIIEHPKNKEVKKKKLFEEVKKYEQTCKDLETKERAILTAMGSQTTDEDDDEESQKLQKQKEKQIQEHQIDSKFSIFNKTEVEKRHARILAMNRDLETILRLYSTSSLAITASAASSASSSSSSSSSFSSLSSLASPFSPKALAETISPFDPDSRSRTPPRRKEKERDIKIEMYPRRIEKPLTVGSAVDDDDEDVIEKGKSQLLAIRHSQESRVFKKRKRNAIITVAVGVTLSILFIILVAALTSPK